MSDEDAHAGNENEINESTGQKELPVVNEPSHLVRKMSLASELEAMAHSGAFVHAVQENLPAINQCREILRKPTGKRSFDDIHMLKSLLATTKLLDFFSNLDTFKIDKLYQSLEIGCYADIGTFVFQQGDPGESFYMVFRGQVEILQMDDMRNRTHVAYLGPGDSFGERALLYESDRRAATVQTTCSNTELVFVHRNIFTKLHKESQEAPVGANDFELTRHFRSNKDIIRDLFIRPSDQRTEEDLKFAVEYLNSVKFFSRFTFDVRKKLCRVMRLITAVTNTVLFEEEQVGRSFYILLSGSVEVKVKTTNRFGDKTDIIVGRLGEGESFGELALLEDNGVRHATVTSVDYCELLVLNRDQYEPLIKIYQNDHLAQYTHLLRKNSYFNGPEWDDHIIERLCSVMTEKQYPFHGEICKQGSRASEMFIIIRGECVMTCQGKHPITGAPQQYNLGRFGPNSIVGCAEACAGKFNDIYLRDYSITATSPLLVLILSRFDIFHLLSTKARESLQQSSSSSVNETIESRAMKTIAWERYRKDFINEITTEKEQECFSIGRGPMKLSKSHSVPGLTTGSEPVSLIDPGSLVLESRRSRARKKKLHLRLDLPLDRMVTNTDPTQSPTETGSSKESRSPIQEIKSRAFYPDGKDCNNVNPSTHAIQKSQRRHTHHIPNPASFHGTVSVCSAIPRKKDEENTDQSLTPTQLRPLVKSKTIASLGSGEITYSTALPAHLSEKPLYRSIAVNNNIGERRRSARTKSDVGIVLKSVNNTTAMWNPVHGPCLPFSILGFMKEKLKSSSVYASSRPSTRASVYSGKLGTDHTSKAIPDDNMGQVISCFRLFGKFAELNEALDVFRHICTLELIPPASKDTSSFAIYKEDEMTMSLENFFNEAVKGSVKPYKYQAEDFPKRNGQRYASISVLHEKPARIIENVTVLVYQCFPTIQSAVRFSKHVMNMSFSATTLYVVPLFEWIPLAELERFDARNSDLEQALESVLSSITTLTLSTCKSRKDATKKARLQEVNHKSSH